jgi:hypothetical protein
MLVAVDKFTKWVEAAPVTTQYSTAAINFIKSIVFRFGLPHVTPHFLKPCLSRVLVMQEWGPTKTFCNQINKIRVSCMFA